MIVSGEAVLYGHPLETARVVNHDIRDREREFVFETSGIQIAEVNADPDLPVLLGDENNVGYPVRVLLFPDETGVYELFDFRFNCLHNLWTESPLLLLDWFRVRLMLRRCMGTCGSRSGMSL